MVDNSTDLLPKQGQSSQFRERYCFRGNSCSISQAPKPGSINCLVFGCKNKQYNCNESFHCLPKTPSRRQQWLHIVKSGKQPSRYSRICSAHFADEDVEKKAGKFVHFCHTI
jgi:hypothetical protein